MATCRIKERWYTPYYGNITSYSTVNTKPFPLFTAFSTFFSTIWIPISCFSIRFIQFSWGTPAYVEISNRRLILCFKATPRNAKINKWTFSIVINMLLWKNDLKDFKRINTFPFEWFAQSQIQLKEYLREESEKEREQWECR